VAEGDELAGDLARAASRHRSDSRNAIRDGLPDAAGWHESAAHVIRAIPYQDPQQKAERLKAVHEARVEIVSRV
jgi:hypothetical protein